MIKAVADSGPFIHLAVINHVALLQRYFQPFLILPQIYDEVVTQGMGRPGAPELAAACDSRIVRLCSRGEDQAALEAVTLLGQQ